ncbi:MAG: DinB family protein [Thermoanaerobaculia bacterium]|nr:DinB family protein [Thermoanaerobaculia bacterium]
MIQTSRSELEALAAEAQGDLWSRKPSEDEWSAGEVVEHLVLAEEMFLPLVARTLQGEPDPDWQGIAQRGTAALEANLQDRSRKFQAPEMLQPAGEAPRDELLARFAKGRTLMLDLVRSTDAPVKQLTYEGPPGHLNVHQWLALVGAHTLRHNQQIREVLDAVGSGD